MILKCLATDSHVLQHHVLQHHVPCRVCGQVGLNPVLSQECEAPPDVANLANGIAWCPTCSLVQRTEPISSTRSFGILPAGEEEKQSARLMAERLCETRQLGPDSLVVEIAGNGPELLKSYHQQGIPVLAVGPAHQPVRTIEFEESVCAISGTFGTDLALELVRANRRADVIHINDAFANMTDLNGVVAGLATLMKPDGVVVAVVPYLKDHSEFNAVDREDLCYFSLTSLTQLFGQHGLEIVDVERVKSHGGLFRITAARFGTTSVTTAVHDLMDDEAAWVRDPDIHQLFGDAIAPRQDQWAA